MKRNKEEIHRRIVELRRAIEDHNRRYYVLNKPVISDFEFDILLNDLIALEKQYPEFSSSDSPSNRVGSDLSDEDRSFVKVKHKYPMYSLSNTYDLQELRAFIKKILDLFPSTPVGFVSELKFDGTAISLTYKGGKLIRALTRGDGITGEDVLRNVKNITSIPGHIDSRSLPDEFEVRGEIYMPYSVFEQLNLEREESGENLFANPRNAAAGSLKLLDSGKANSRGLECVVYQLVSDQRISDSHFETLQILKNAGFPVSEYNKICSSDDEVVDFLNYWDNARKNLPFATDGAVIKVDTLDLQERLGFTAKSPKWATAYKFRAEQAVTKLLSVDFQVGRTGAITPVANLEPVFLSGTTIKRASLHNADQIALLGICYNDYVVLEKGGEIIPKIVDVDVKRRDSGEAVAIKFPERCPDCGTRLEREDSEARHFCPNSSGCPTQIKARFVHFCSRKAMNILAGDAYIDQFFNSGLIKELPDLYKIDLNALLELDGWKERSALRFLQSLSDSKKSPFAKVLFALGIRYVGETTAKNLARHFGSIEKLASASLEELSNVPEVGSILAKSISEYFASENNMRMIEEFRNIGLNFADVADNSLNVSNKLEGFVIVVSGNFSKSREFIKELISTNGGKCGSSVSKNTTYLLAGEKSGPAKLKEAEKLGIPVIDENELYKLIE